MDAARLHHVTKRYGNLVAVDDLTLVIPQRSIYGLIGPNGSGKTTTLRMLVNILLPDTGRIEILGTAARGSRLPGVGYLPEERGLYRKMRVKDYLRFVADLRSPSFDAGEMAGWLTRLNLEAHASRKIETLSKGMSQKVQFLAAVLPRPSIAVMDEPFTGLDPISVDTIRSALLSLRDQGTTIVLSTHDMNLAESLCDFICMIHKGRKVLDGTLEEIRAIYGRDTIRVRTLDGVSALQHLPGIDSIHDLGGMQELHLKETADPRKILAGILSRTTVKHFELAHPTLHDIFVRIAGPGSQEVPAPSARTEAAHA